MFNRIKLNLLLALLLVMGPFSAAHAEAYCATVKIEIAQELSLERQAFDAVMKINNGLDTLSIENVSISVNFADENGDPVLATNDPNETNPAAKFFIRVDSMNGINSVDGTGVVAPGTTAEVRWLIIPIPGSADGLPGGKLYFVGANLTYLLGGEPEEVNVAPDFITVMPLPQLALDYFLTQEVIGDDAFTPAVEAPEPYTLGVRIKNNGTGIANNIKIDSAQPKIIENDQLLLIDFKIIGSTLNDQPALPTLLIDFGTIQPGEATVGRWIMETSLSGQFTEFTAKVTHADELGGDVTSIIDSNDINTHFLLRDVRVDLPGRDLVRDFLGYPAGATGVLKVYESDTVDTDVNNASVGTTFNVTSVAGSAVNYNLTMPVLSGFNYAQIPDPHNGQKVITSAIRSDGKVMLLDNVWTSKTRNRNDDPPTWEYWVNIFDVNTTGIYSVTMNDLVIGPQAPVIQVITDKITFEDNQVGFVVESSDPNGDTVFLSAEPMPAGATFIDNGDGTAFFNWTPTTGQAGTYLITYKATDSVLSSQRTATIKVNSATDTDGDGLDDAWEMEHFGNLDRDGTGDFDGDGISDLDEFLDGTDPNLLPPVAPGDMTASSGNLQATFNWSALSGATAYNLYWSETPGVTKVTGFAINDVVSPFTHAGLINDTSYYYAIASVGAGGESGLSAEVVVIPGNKNWGVPGVVENSIYDIQEYQVAYAGNGTGMAVWTEDDTLHTNVWASLYTVGTGWGLPQLVELSDTANASDIRVKMDDFGNAVVIWKQVEGGIDSIWSNNYSVAGNWGAAMQVTSANTGELGQAELILTNSGAAMVNWLQAVAGQTQMSQVWSSLLFANATAWNPAERIETNIAVEVSGLQMANDGSGNVISVWSQTADAGSSYDFVFNRFTSGLWGAESIIRSAMAGDAQAPVITPVLAVNQAGDAILAWTELNTINSVMAMTYTVTTGWNVATLVEFDDVNPAYDPSIALSDSGDAIVVWTQSNGTQDVINSNRYSAVSTWEVSTTIVSSEAVGDPVGIASAAKVKIDAAGNSVVVWQQIDSVQSNIWNNRYDLSSGWEGPAIIDYANDGDAIAPVIALDVAGNGIVSWVHSDGVIRNLLFNDLTALNTGMPNILPVVKLPADLTVSANDAVVIDGSASFDQDGFIALYEWTQVSGTVVTLTGQYTDTLSFTVPAVPVTETLVFRLTATDGDGAIGTGDISVLVNVQNNILPTANAGVDQTVNELDIVTLAGIASDADGSIASYSWTQTGGSAVVITNANTATATFTAPNVYQNTVLSFTLTVTDNLGGSASDIIDIAVVSVTTDDDADGMLDTWEIQNFGTLDRDGTGDFDNDGISDIAEFNSGSNPVSNDSDGDGVLDSTDNCLLVANPTQANLDGDAFGDACDDDIDGDGYTVALGDTNDYDNTIYPGAPEICGDGIDQDANGSDLVCTIPVISPAVNQSINIGAALNILLSATDAGGDNLSFSINTLATFVVLTDNGDGTAVLSGTSGSADVGDHLVNITVVDDGNPQQLATTSFTLSVVSVNSAPVAVVDLVSTDENTSAVFAVLSNDTDADGDTLSISSVQLTSAAGGVVVDNGDGTVTYTPALNYSGTDNFQYTVSDGNGGTASASVLITINPAPVVANGDVNGDGEINISDVLLMQQHIYGVTVLDAASIQRGDLYPTVGDGQITVSDVLLLQQIVLTQTATVIDSDGDLLPDDWEIANGLNPNDASDAILDNDADGLTNLQERHYGTAAQIFDTDGDGFSDGEEVSVGTNPADIQSYPVKITSTPIIETQAGSTYFYELQANQPNVVYELVTAPVGAAIVDNAGVQAIQWTSTVIDIGVHTVLVKASVDGVPSDTQTYTITISGIPGDVNLDASLNLADSLLAQRHLLKVATLTAEQFALGDVYPVGAPDGKITISDILLIQQLVLGGQ